MSNVQVKDKPTIVTVVMGDVNDEIGVDILNGEVIATHGSDMWVSTPEGVIVGYQKENYIVGKDTFPIFTDDAMRHDWCQYAKMLHGIDLSDVKSAGEIMYQGLVDEGIVKAGIKAARVYTLK